jgi:ATP-binding cassette, subfamily B, bacterial PglK
MLKSIWKILSHTRKKQFVILLTLMILASLVEVISIGAVFPFLGVLTAPEEIYAHSSMQFINTTLGITHSSQLLFPLTIVFISIVFIAGGVRLLLLYLITRFSIYIGGDISNDIYQKSLYQKYSVHISRNSSVVINGIIVKVNDVIHGVFNPMLILISSSLLVIAIVGTLFIINFKVAIFISIFFGSFYVFVILYTKNKIRKNSEILSKHSTLMVQSLQEGLGGIRDILIDNSQEFYCNVFKKSNLLFRKAAADNQFISGSPRYVLEVIGVSVIVGFAYTMTKQQDSLLGTIPILGAMALGAQRLLPAIQMAYHAYSTIKGVHSSFEDILVLLRQKIPNTLSKDSLNTISFKEEIVLEDIWYRYKSSQNWTLKGVSLRITKGSKIGIIGETGSGKSTLVDIVMGLLSVDKGRILIDNICIGESNLKSWMSHLAHIPQNIYLSDGTVEQNIAFGVDKEKIDHAQLKKAAEGAKISDVIETWKDGYQTIVGEQGVSLSGGQKQRIGIARALYKDSSLLLLDEATSSLDNSTERQVMESIQSLSKDVTIIIIAHRLTTLEMCDTIFKLNNDGSVQIVKYKDLIYNKHNAIGVDY